MDTFDLIILGSGCSGLSAAIYAKRFEMSTLVIGDVPGGLITTTHLVENWPGFPSISGWDLGTKIFKHAQQIGAVIKQVIATKVESVSRNGKMLYQVTTDEGQYIGRSILFATGTEHRKLNVPGEKEFSNRGVSYCATCDGALFKDKIIAVIGGSDSAAKEALLLSEYGKKVYIIYRGEQIRPEPINAKRVEANTKIEIINNTNVIEIVGDKMVTSVKLDSGKTLLVDGVFIEVGQLPRSEFAESLGVALNEKREIVIDRESRTNLPKVYAAGDVADNPFKQAITGAAEGVAAAIAAYKDLKAEDTVHDS